MTRHGTPPATPGLSPACFSHLSPLLVFGETTRLAGSQTPTYSLSTLWAVFQVGPFSFLSAKLGSVWPKPAPDRAGTGPFPTWGVNSPHRPSRGGETLGYFVPEGFSRNKPWLVLPQGASWGRIWALGGFVGTGLGTVVFPCQCCKERNPHRGEPQASCFPRHLRHWW